MGDVPETPAVIGVSLSDSEDDDADFPACDNEADDRDCSGATDSKVQTESGINLHSAETVGVHAQRIPPRSRSRSISLREACRTEPSRGDAKVEGGRKSKDEEHGIKLQERHSPDDSQKKIEYRQGASHKSRRGEYGERQTYEEERTRKRKGTKTQEGERRWSQDERRARRQEEEDRRKRGEEDRRGKQEEEPQTKGDEDRRRRREQEEGEEEALKKMQDEGQSREVEEDQRSRREAGLKLDEQRLEERELVVIDDDNALSRKDNHKRKHERAEDSVEDNAEEVLRKSSKYGKKPSTVIAAPETRRISVYTTEQPIEDDIRDAPAADGMHMDMEGASEELAEAGREGNGDDCPKYRHGAAKRERPPTSSRRAELIEARARRGEPLQDLESKEKRPAEAKNLECERRPQKLEDSHRRRKRRKHEGSQKAKISERVVQNHTAASEVPGGVQVRGTSHQMHSAGTHNSASSRTDAVAHERSTGNNMVSSGDEEIMRRFNGLRETRDALRDGRNGVGRRNADHGKTDCSRSRSRSHRHRTRRHEEQTASLMDRFQSLKRR